MTIRFARCHSLHLQHSAALHTLREHPMKALLRLLLPASLAVHTAIAIAGPPEFSGTWSIDLRNAAERLKGADCGVAAFELLQQSDRITGNHTMTTVGCGRLNDGGGETVKGVVVGNTAVLVVTSSRTGAVVMGTAELHGGALHWNTREEIRGGEPTWDVDLILQKGVLVRSK